MIGFGDTDCGHDETHRRWTPGFRRARMRPQDLTTAKTVAKISVAGNTAGGKSVARRFSESCSPAPVTNRSPCWPMTSLSSCVRFS